MRDGLDRVDGVAADKVDGDDDDKGDCEFERVVDNEEVKEDPEEVAPTVKGSAGVLKDGFSRRDGAAANSNRDVRTHFLFNVFAFGRGYGEHTSLRFECFPSGANPSNLNNSKKDQFFQELLSRYENLGQCRKL